MRLIDADKLKEKIEIEYNKNVGSYCDGLLGAEELIDNAPTVSDRYGEGYADGYFDGSMGVVEQTGKE